MVLEVPVMVVGTVIMLSDSSSAERWVRAGWMLPVPTGMLSGGVNGRAGDPVVKEAPEEYA